MPTPRGRHPAKKAETISNYVGAQTEATASPATGDSLDRESLLRGQKRILESTARGRPLAEVLYETVLFLEERQPGTVCGIMLVDHSLDQLCYAAAPSLPDDLLSATDNLPLDEKVGTCVRSVLLGEPYFMEDPETDPLAAPLIDLVRRHSVSRFWSMPIKANSGELVGIFIVLGRGPNAPQPDWNLLAIAADLVSIAVERSRAEEARNLNLLALLENMAEGVVAVDGAGHVIVANPAAQRLLGLASVRNGAPLQTAGLPALLEEALLAMAAGERERPERLLLRQGQAHLSAYVSPVGKELGSYGALTLLRDVTEEVRLRNLQESFLINVSHELRAPLALLSAALEAMVDGVIPDDERPRYLQVMMREMDRLRRLSYDVIELTRLESGPVEADLREFPLDLIFESRRERVGRRCQQAGIHLEVSPCGLRVRTDYDRVERALEQLLDNAIRFTPRGGHVRLHARGEGRHVRVLVEDDGIGIPREHQALIWERFYKVDPARRREPGSGTGLGLAIVRQILTGLGSEVAVESEAGKGSTFHFTLPLAPG